MSANFPLSAALATDHTFHYVVFSFLFKRGLFWFTLIGSLWETSRTSLAIGTLEWIGSMWRVCGVILREYLQVALWIVSDVTESYSGTFHNLLLRQGTLGTCRFWKKPSRLFWLPPPPWELLVYTSKHYFLICFLEWESQIFNSLAFSMSLCLPFLKSGLVPWMDIY